MAANSKKTDDSLAIAEPENDVKMTIWEHIGELRSRLTKAAIGVGIGTIACWIYHEKLLHWLVIPYEQQWKQKNPTLPVDLQGLAPQDAFVNYMQLSFTGGIVLAIPIVFYQLWAFISPGLYSREKRYIYPFVTFSTLLFLAGVAFAYKVSFPFMFSYFLSLTGAVDGDTSVVLTIRPTMEFYVDLTTRMLLAFGAVFELPLFIAFLAIAGIVTPKQLLKFSRWAIILSFALGAIVTPGPEVSSQIAVSGALVGLYFISVGLAFIVGKKPPKEEDDKEKAASD
jgi:sec-independent protein translocase protein TatC